MADDYDEALLDYEGALKQTPHAENILQKVAKSFSKVNPNQVGYEISGGTGPTDIGMGLASKAFGGSFSSGLNTASRAEGARKTGAGGNMLLDIASDPTTYGGLYGGGSLVKDVGEKVFPYTSQEARVGFTKGVENSLIKRRSALTRSFGKALERSKAKVDISSIVEPGSEITELTMKEAQDLKNALTSGIPDAVKKGVKVSPKHFQNSETAGMLSNLMKKADPEMAKTIEKYGVHAENYKDAIKPIAGDRGSESIFGGNLLKRLTGTGTMPEKSSVALKEFAPKVAKKVSNASINQNIFRGVRGATVGKLIWPFVPNTVKRTVASEITS